MNATERKRNLPDPAVMPLFCCIAHGSDRTLLPLPDPDQSPEATRSPDSATIASTRPI
jgi:hypothetical protein